MHKQKLIELLQAMKPDEIEIQILDNDGAIYTDFSVFESDETILLEAHKTSFDFSSTPNGALSEEEQKLKRDNPKKFFNK